MISALAAQPLAAQVAEIHFNLVANPPFLNCLAASPYEEPTATVTVIRGELNDTLQLDLHHVKPNLAFDLFTVQNSQLLADGRPDPAFKNFGLAWYQTDVQADNNGDAEVQIHTILLDQIFGFDPASNLKPTHTFHVGFWFADPASAAACGFNPDKPTPFNGEQKAGPNAMISLPNAESHLGPLCSDPSGKACDL